MQLLRAIAAQTFVKCFKEDMNEPACERYQESVKNIEDLKSVAEKMDDRGWLHVGRLIDMYNKLEACTNVTDAIQYLISQHTKYKNDYPSPTTYYQYSCVIAAYLKDILKEVRLNNQFTEAERDTIKVYLAQKSHANPRQAEYIFATAAFDKENKIVSVAPASNFWAKKEETKAAKEVCDNQSASPSRCRQ